MQKRLSITFLLCLLALTAMSQPTLQSVKAPNKTDANGLRQGRWVFMYDKDWNRVQNKSQAEFYRVAVYQDDKFVGKVADYYKSGKPQMVADSIIDVENSKYHGKVVYYHSDGKKESVATYQSGEFIKEVYYNLDGSMANQSWKEVNDKGVELGDVGKYKEAQVFYEKGLVLVKKQYPKYHKNQVTALSNLAICFKGQKLYGKAANLYEQALGIQGKLSDNNTLKYATLLKKTADSYYYQKEYAKAQPLFKRALEIRKHELGTEHKLYLISLVDLAYTFQKAKKYEEAEEALLELLIVQKKKHGVTHKNYVTILLNLLSVRKKLYKVTDEKYVKVVQRLADIYYVKDEYQKAIPLYKELMMIQLRVNGKESLTYAKPLKDLGNTYYHQQQYAKAYPLFEEVLKIKKKKLKPEDKSYLTSLIRFAYNAKKAKKYQEAIPAFIELVEIRKKLHYNTHDYVVAVKELAMLYYKQESYAKAIPLYQGLLNTQAQSQGKENVEYTVYLNGLGRLYYESGLYLKAISAYKELVQLYGKIYGTSDEKYTKSLNDLASSYDAMGFYQKALPLYIKAKAITEKILGKNHPAYAVRLNNLAFLYKNMGLYQKALPLYLESKSIRKDVFGENHPAYFNSLGNLGGLYQSMGLYKKAKLLYLESKKIREKVLGKNHSDYAIALGNLARLYQTTGLYDKAESLFLESKNIYQNKLGKSHPLYASSLNNLGSFYRTLGMYQKAESLYEESKSIREKVLGKEHPDYAASLSNLALLYSSMGVYKKAESLFLESKSIDEKVFGKQHFKYSTSLSNLALLYSSMGLYKKAESLFLESKSIDEKVFGKQHPNYATSLNNLGSIYRKLKKYEKAIFFHIRCKDIYIKTLGKRHPLYITALNNLAFLYDQQKNYPKALPLYLESINTKLQELAKNKVILSEKGQKKYLKANQLYFNNFKRFFIEYINQTEKVSEADKGKLAVKVLDLQLALKGWLLNGKQRLVRLIAQKAASDTALVNTYEEYLSLKAQTAKQINLSLEEKQKRKIDIAKNIERIEGLEKQLYKKIGVEINSNTNYSFATLKQSLKAQEAAIEIVKQGAKYIFLIVTPRQAYPHVILLESKVLEAQAKTYQKAILSKSEDKTSYAKFWQKVGEYLQAQGVKRVYISPDGVYNQINLNTLFNPVATAKAKKKVYVEDEVDIQLVTTLREVIDAPTKRTSKPTASQVALFGRPNYELPLANLQKEEKALKAAQQNGLNLSDFHFPPTSDKLLKQGKNSLRSGWADLPGTEAEIKAIAVVLGKQKQLKVNTHLGNEALELLVKQVTRPKILHIATHGFFIENFKAPTKVQKEEVVFDNFSRGGKTASAASVAKIAREEPMLRSGIVLAGAGTYEKANPKPETEDGILTAYEAAQMDLQGTELVVLSACETGLGEIENNEGVQGLQRAFIVAGAQSVILSLWKVDDNATKLLMSHFYEAWASGKLSKRAAFRAAQRHLRNYEKNGKKIYAAPYYWGAFVMVGE